MQAARRGTATWRILRGHDPPLSTHSRRLVTSNSFHYAALAFDCSKSLTRSWRTQANRILIAPNRVATRATHINATADTGEPIASFRELGEQGRVCQTVVDTLTQNMGMENMTDVQRLTINETLKGVDTVAQARTGTGKTLAFLIPIVQNIIKHDASLENTPTHSVSGPSRSIRALVISPTRELAEQIAQEARKVTRNTGIIVQTAVGGTQKYQGLQKIRRGCDILVGTPGRLKDILSNPYQGVKAPNLGILVLDEADRLLEAGFEEEIREIQRLLPDKRNVDRQTLLFSATISREIMPVVRATMKPDFKLVRTVQKGEQPTHTKVPQRLAEIGGFENQMPALVELCLREMKDSTPERPFKAIVFFPTLNEVILAAQVMRRLSLPSQAEFAEVGFPSSTKIRELHSRLDQHHRTAATDAFRGDKSAILLSSDVAARGMDFPGVTHVIQAGLPPNEEQYIHRIGRTARAGQTGEAWLLISDLEKREVRGRLPQMPLTPDRSLEAAHLRLGSSDPSGRSRVPEALTDILSKLQQCLQKLPSDLKNQAYAGTFGLFPFARRDRLVATANARAVHALGLEEPPPVSRRTVLKFGLDGIPGVRIGEDDLRRPSYSREGNSQRGWDRGQVRAPRTGFRDNNRDPRRRPRERLY